MTLPHDDPRRGTPPRLGEIAAVIKLYPVGEWSFKEFTLRQVLLNGSKKTDQDPLPLAFPAGGGPEYCPGLPQRRPPVRPRRPWSGRPALRLPRARLD